MKWVAGIFVGVAVAVGVGMALAIGGIRSEWGARAVLAAGAGAGFLAWRGIGEERPVRLGFWDVTVLGALTLAAFRAFFWLYYEDGDQLKVLSPHNLGDLSLHMGLVRYFASGVAFWPPSPILVGEPLTYPPGADFFHALLVVAGLGVWPGFVLCGFLGALAGGWALWRYGGAFSVAALIFGGGLAGFEIFRTGAFVEYGGEDVWKNAFLTMLVTQRGFLYALPVGVVLLWGWWGEFFSGKRRVPFWVQVVLYATMPLFQLHTFLFLSAALVSAVVVFPRGWRHPAGLILASLPAGTAGVLAVTGFFRAKGALRFEPGWAAEGGMVELVLEFGPALLLGVIALVGAWKSGDPAARWMGVTCAGAALVGFLVPLNDWAWDNTKILIWAWLGASPLIWQYAVGRVAVPARVALCGLLFFSGAVGLAAGLDRRHGYVLADLGELAEWESLLADVPSGAVIACESTYNHPVFLLGRPVVCGYEGHLSSHGLEYREKLEALRRIVALQPGWRELAKSIGATHVAPPGKGAVLLPVDD